MLHAAGCLGSCLVILLHGFLHAIIDQTSSIWLEQLLALSITSIHSLQLNANKPLTMTSAAPTPSNPSLVTPASSKASSSICSGGVSFAAPEAIHAPLPSNKHHADIAFVGNNDDEHFVGAITDVSAAVASPLASRPSQSHYPTHTSRGTKPTKERCDHSLIASTALLHHLRIERAYRVSLQQIMSSLQT